MIDIVLHRQSRFYVPFSDHDHEAGLVFPENMMLRARISGSKKPRSYRELSCYFSSCTYIAELDLDGIPNTKEMVDEWTKRKCEFLKGTYTDHMGLLQWPTDSLSYENCDQARSHAFMVKAFEEHAALAMVYDVDLYIKGLGGE